MLPAADSSRTEASMPVRIFNLVLVSFISFNVHLALNFLFLQGGGRKAVLLIAYGNLASKLPARRTNQLPAEADLAGMVPVSYLILKKYWVKNDS